jgi:hypothetical protein
LIYLGASCNRTDDDNVSITGPQFDEYPSGAGTIKFINTISD